jgi:RNA ligase (TIGR02306 family)
MMENSTHRVEVIRIDSISPHPNADRLEIVKVFSGYQVVVQKGTYQLGDLAAYVPPDSLVPTDQPEFAFLKDRPESPRLIEGREYHRIKAIKLRGQYSMGMLVPVKFAVTSVGSDIAAGLGVLHYVPPVKNENTSKKTTYGSRAEAAPEKDFGKPPSYDLEALRRYADIFEPGEPVVVTEKIHGANARYTYGERGWYSASCGYRGQFSLRIGRVELSRSSVGGFKLKRIDATMLNLRCGSRNQWKRPDTNDIWWRVALQYPNIARFCQSHPGKVLYGEVYGDVQDLDYGLSAGQIAFAAFDILGDDGKWLDWTAFVSLAARYDLPTVPVLYEGPFDLDKILALAEGPSVLFKDTLPVIYGGNVARLLGLTPNDIRKAATQPPHTREGIVVKPVREGWHPRLGRKALKAVGNSYMERAA